MSSKPEGVRILDYGPFYVIQRCALWIMPDGAERWRFAYRLTRLPKALREASIQRRSFARRPMLADF